MTDRTATAVLATLALVGALLALTLLGRAQGSGTPPEYSCSPEAAPYVLAECAPTPAP